MLYIVQIGQHCLFDPSQFNGSQTRYSSSFFFLLIFFFFPLKESHVILIRK